MSWMRFAAARTAILGLRSGAAVVVDGRGGVAGVLLLPVEPAGESVADLRGISLRVVVCLGVCSASTAVQSELKGRCRVERFVYARESRDARRPNHPTTSLRPYALALHRTHAPRWPHEQQQQQHLTGRLSPHRARLRARRASSSREASTSATTTTPMSSQCTSTDASAGPSCRP